MDRDTRRFTVAPARSETELVIAARMFGEYADFIKARLDVDLASHGFQEEIDSLPGFYAPPNGELLLAITHAGGNGLGVVGIKAANVPGWCEIKRLFVPTSLRGVGIGRALLSAAVDFAASSGYTKIVLDTKASLTQAIALYEAFGFEQIPLYWDNPVPDTIAYGRIVSSSAAASPSARRSNSPTP